MDAPPPYSETDPSEVLSVAGTTSTGASTSYNSAITTFSHRFNDAGSLRANQTAASSVEDVLHSPQYGSNQSNSALDDQAHITSSSAAAYFESRPVTNIISAPPITHGLSVELHTQPKDLPFPSSFETHEVLESDWLTFVNYLLPDYILRASGENAGRKSQDGISEEGMQRLGVDEKLKTNNNEAEKQSSPVTSRDGVKTTVAEWNEGFFKPRGLLITLYDADVENVVVEAREASQTISPREQNPQVPGAWIPYDHELMGESSSAGRRRGFFGGLKSFQAGSHGKFRMGPIVADNEGFRMGNVFVADQKGLRVGGSKGFVADDSGVSMGGRSFFRRESTEPERGRCPSCGQRRKSIRSSSVSSTSSATSEESVASESSMGSLPEYDDIAVQQLPVIKQSLLRSLRQTEPLTKSTVSQIRKDIQHTQEINSLGTEEDLVMLRKEVKDLLKEFREYKRKRRRDQQKARRERHTLRRKQRTERRNAKREARRLKRKGKEISRRPPWMASRSTIDLQQPPPMPPRPQLDSAPGFPFSRTVSAPFIHPPSCNKSSNTTLSPGSPPVPGVAVMHSTWPYTRNAPYSPGAISTPTILGEFPSLVTASSEALYTQAKELEQLAGQREEEAMQLRTEASGRHLQEKERLKKLDEAEKLEEEAEKWSVEAERLRAEAEALDGELARDLEESGGGASSQGRPPEVLNGPVGFRY